MIKKIKAFTLIELVVTMTLAAILFVIAAPTFFQFQKSYRLKSSVQKLETTFGEAFSRTRSHPEHFMISGEAEVFKLEICGEGGDCGNILSTREFSLSPGVRFREPFVIKFIPPFGNIEIAESEEDQLDIEIYNDESVIFRVYEKSGLVTRVIDTEIVNPEEDEI